MSAKRFRWPWNKLAQSPRPSVSDLYQAHSALSLSRTAMDLGNLELARQYLCEAEALPGTVWPGILEWHRSRLGEMESSTR